MINTYHSQQTSLIWVCCNTLVIWQVAYHGCLHMVSFRLPILHTEPKEWDSIQSFPHAFPTTCLLCRLRLCSPHCSESESYQVSLPSLFVRWAMGLRYVNGLIMCLSSHQWSFGFFFVQKRVENIWMFLHSSTVPYKTKPQFFSLSTTLAENRFFAAISVLKNRFSAAILK